MAIRAGFRSGTLQASNSFQSFFLIAPIVMTLRYFGQTAEGITLIFADSTLGVPGRPGSSARRKLAWWWKEKAARGCVTHISANGQHKRAMKKTGLPNGLAVDRDGVIWVAEAEMPSLVRLTMEGKGRDRRHRV